MADQKISELPAHNAPLTDGAITAVVPEGLVQTRRMSLATLKTWIIDFLGGAATREVGTAAGTVAAGDDSRITSAVQPDWVTPVTNFAASEATLAAHRNTIRRCTAGSPVTITLDALPVGSAIGYLQAGAGAITFAPGAGQTVVSFAGALTSAGQHSRFTAQVVAANTWHVSGPLV